MLNEEKNDNNNNKNKKRKYKQDGGYGNNDCNFEEEE